MPVVAVLIAVVTLGGACGSEEGGADGADGSGSARSEEEPAGDTALEGPEAPDFALDLADGSEFVLSEEERVTFLVFWAEW